MTDLDLRPVTLLSFNKGWQPPTTDEIRTVLKYIDMSGGEAASRVGVNSRTVRKWTAGETTIPFAVWAIFVEMTTGELIWKE